MRLDKFLKVSRIIKRRPIAKIVVDGGKAKINISNLKYWKFLKEMCLKIKATIW